MDDKVIVDLLGQVGNLFTSSLELKETIDFMLKAASDLAVCDAATVFLLDEDDLTLAAIATFPFGESVSRVARFKLGEGIVGWAAKQRKIVSVSDATKDSRFKNLEMGYSPRSVLIMPLESPRRLVGALTIARKEVNPFTSVEQALMQIIANQAAISIDNARLYTTQRRQIKEIADRTRELEIANAHIAEISRLKSEFLANMSHELRTPLNAILGFSEILKDNLVELSEDQRHECLENIHASGKHLLELVNDVLDLSKIEAGRMELAYDRFQVGNAVREVHNVIRSLSERRDIDLAITVEPDDLETRADKSKFKQILYNLLSNAIKFTAQGGRVWVAARPENGWLVVDVGDTGVGIPKEYHERIFDEFYQLDTATTRQVEGTGLGLSLTRRLVELHGGDIRVDFGGRPGVDLHLPAPAARHGASERAGPQPDPPGRGQPEQPPARPDGAQRQRIRRRRRLGRRRGPAEGPLDPLRPRPDGRGAARDGRSDRHPNAKVRSQDRRRPHRRSHRQCHER